MAYFVKRMLANKYYYIHQTITRPTIGHWVVLRSKIRIPVVAVTHDFKFEWTLLYADCIHVVLKINIQHTF